MKGDLTDDVQVQKFSELRKYSDHLWYVPAQTHYAENHKYLQF